MKMLEMYMPILRKTSWRFLWSRASKRESEKFAGAIDTYTIEALMQDGKALQGRDKSFPRTEFCKGI
ncbi:MAG: hypothetical protein MZV63_61910 [Marinilabiliales bacterium]|nr:hypothetical protein [Marinilabiliales bacterium]